MHHQNRVEGKHEAIIPVGIFNLVQQEIANHRKLDNPLRGDHLFLGRIRCRVFGVSYGPKVWHSNDKYCKEIWQCNNKYKRKRHLATHQSHRRMRSSEDLRISGMRCSILLMRRPKYQFKIACRSHRILCVINDIDCIPVLQLILQFCGKVYDGRSFRYCKFRRSSKFI